MAQQQHRRLDIEWVVVDDGAKRTPMTQGQKVIRPNWRWNPGDMTLCRNVSLALEHVTQPKVLFIEDDDYYPPGYVQYMADALDAAALVGQIPARYYNVRTRQYRLVGNDRHASLCQTAMKRTLTSVAQEICEGGSPFIDLALFRAVHNKWLITSAHHQAVGIKGMPGRAGIGFGHRPHPGWYPDTDLAVLRSWIGVDAEVYAQRYSVRIMEPVQ